MRFFGFAAAVVLVAGCGSDATTPAGSTVAATFAEYGIALVAADTQPGTVYVLAHSSTGGGPALLSVNKTGHTAPVTLSLAADWRPGTPLITVRGGRVWLADAHAVYRIDPATGRTLDTIRSKADDDSISAIAVRGDRLYFALNSTPVVRVVDLESGARHDIAVPREFAGPRALGVDAQGWLYLGSAHRNAGKTAVVDPRGHLAATLGVVTTQVADGPGGVEVLPGNENACVAHLGGTITHTYPMGQHVPSACLLADDGTALGWHGETGGFTYSHGEAVVDRQPSVPPSTVVSPRGETITTSPSDAPKAVCLTPDGTVWSLGWDGRSVSYQD